MRVEERDNECAGLNGLSVMKIDKSGSGLSSVRRTFQEVGRNLDSFEHFEQQHSFI